MAGGRDHECDPGVADHLAAEGAGKVTLESTSDYWRIWFYLLEAAGLDVQLVRARDVKQAPGRPKTDKLDAVWLAKLTERGMLRPSFVPPSEIRQVRDFTRLRTDLARERARHYSRLEKLLEDALIKVSAVASRLDTKSVRDMLEALIAGQRDPQVLADLARGRMRSKRDRLVQALTGKFDDHHGELARMLLDQIDALSAQIGKLTTRIEELIAAIPAAQGIDTDGTTGPDAGRGPGAPVLPAVDRLDEVTGIGREAAQAIIAEIGLYMSAFPTEREARGVSVRNRKANRRARGNSARPIGQDPGARLIRGLKVPGERRRRRATRTRFSRPRGVPRRGYPD